MIFLNWLRKIFGKQKPAHHSLVDWFVHFPRVDGYKGDKKVIVVEPQCMFRGEKLIAMDSGGGGITRVCEVLVGQQLQHPCAAEGVLTSTFDKTAVGNGMAWKTCHPNWTIAVTIVFLEDGWWEGTVFGKALI